MDNIIFNNFGFSVIKTDKKRLRMLKSFEDDINAHFKIIRGKIFEIKRPDNYGGSIGDFLTKVSLESSNIFFYKNRFKITKPPSKGTSDGYRIVFGLIRKEDGSFLYIPVLVFIAKEEEKTLNVNGKKLKLRSANLKTIIKERVSDLLSI